MFKNRIKLILFGSPSRSVLVKGSALSFAVRFVAFGGSFVLHLFLARIMGVAEYGVYAYVLTWISILVLFSNMGWDTALLRLIASYQAKKQWPLLRGVLIQGERTVFLSSLLISMTSALVVFIFRNHLDKQLVHSFLLGLALVPLISLNSVKQATLKAFKKVVVAQVSTEILRPLLVVLIGMLLIEIFNIEGNSFLFMGATLMAVAVVFTALSLFKLRSVPKEVQAAKPEFDYKMWTKVTRSMLLISGLHLILHKTDILMIGFFVNTSQAGIYSIVTRITTLILFGISCVNMILPPLIAGLHAEKSKREMQQIAESAFFLTALYSIPVTIGIWFFSIPILEIFGTGFSEGRDSLILLSLGTLVIPLCGSVGFFMTMTGNEKEASRIIGMTAAANIILNACFIPLWGIEGAALATTLTIAWRSLALVKSVWKRLGIKCTPLFIYSQGGSSHD